MDHYSNAVHYYLNREVSCDTQAAYFGRPSNKAVQRIARLMSLTVDPSAPTGLSDEQLQKFANHKKILRLRQKSRNLTAEIKKQYNTTVKGAQGTELYKQKKGVDALLNSTKAKQRDKLLRQARKRHFRNADTERLEQQFASDPASSTPGARVRPTEYEVMERGVLVELTCNVLDNLKEDELDRRIHITKARAALCSRKERQRRGRNACKAALKQVGLPEVKQELYPLSCHPRQCIICIGDETKSYESRTYVYSTVNKMWDHFQSDHLQFIAPDAPIPCRHPICKSLGLILPGVKTFKNHVEMVHEIKSRA